MSQRALAELCGLSQPPINDLCENRTILLNIGHIVRVCSVLGCKLDDIIQLYLYKNLNILNLIVFITYKKLTTNKRDSLRKVTLILRRDIVIIIYITCYIGCKNKLYQ
ncbi:helix-turn-helix domain-containing protein [Bacillus thuringiensis]|uniref:helix-turn-helix domain-containing protein n=1 Tax=Bacillus thuringiensis TaxID=1428 RepID=UPI0020CE6BA3|nr:helix-turn-helix transcriptional regulator [Bacillus thuringiensis]